MQGMALTFKRALFASGLFLFFAGTIALFANMASAAPDPTVLDAFSKGFDAIFLALFSGVLMGVGIALVGNGFVLQMISKKRHVFVTTLFSILFLALSSFAVFFRGASPLLALVSFFAFISASGSFLFTALWYALSNAGRKYLLELR
jgi:hypothetical protein